MTVIKYKIRKKHILIFDNIQKFSNQSNKIKDQDLYTTFSYTISKNIHINNKIKIKKRQFFSSIEKKCISLEVRHKFFI